MDTEYTPIAITVQRSTNYSVLHARRICVRESAWSPRERFVSDQLP